jgi:hypothetical protein
MLLVRKRTTPSELPVLVGEVSSNFFREEGGRVVSTTVPHVINHGFIGRSLYCFIQVAPRLFS